MAHKLPTVCVCVVQVYPTLWGQNVPTIPDIF